MRLVVQLPLNQLFKRRQFEANYCVAVSPLLHCTVQYPSLTVVSFPPYMSSFPLDLSSITVIFFLSLLLSFSSYLSGSRSAGNTQLPGRAQKIFQSLVGVAPWPSGLLAMSIERPSVEQNQCEIAITPHSLQSRMLLSSHLSHPCKPTLGLEPPRRPHGESCDNLFLTEHHQCPTQFLAFLPSHQ